MARQQRTQKLDLNQATAEQLAEIDGFNEQRARLLIEHREMNGPFAGWEDVMKVAGIGQSLMQKLQAAATVGAGAQGRGADGEAESGADGEEEEAQAASGGEEEAEAAGEEEPDAGRVEASSDEDEDEDEQDETDEESPDTGAVTMLVALQALAEMDLGAAAAYEMGATAFADEEVSRQLLVFREDHLRHVDHLERLAAAMGAEPMDRTVAEDSVLARLAEAAEALGPRTALLAMISNEQLTNGTYESMLELPWEEDVLAVLQRNFEDEQRHLSWLEENRDRFAPEQEAATEEAMTD